MKDLKIKLEWSTSNLLVWTVLAMGIGLMIVNIVTIYNIYSYRNDVARDTAGQRKLIFLCTNLSRHQNDFD